MFGFPKRLTSLAMVFALTGSPVVRSACTAFCPHGSHTSADHGASAFEGHEVHTSAATPAVASVHAHHGSSASDEPAAEVATGSSHASSDARLSATCSACRALWQVAFAAGPGVERSDTKLLGAAPLPFQSAAFVLTTTARGASPPGPPVLPPVPVRAPIVLRI